MSPHHDQAIGVGRVVGPYRIDAVLGAGGMGIVYRAHDRARQRTVAIKVVDRRHAASASPRWLVREARVAAALDTLTIGLAREVAGEGIRVNGVRAGIIYTDIHADGGEPGRVDRLGPTLPMKRGGDAIEVARAILWLCSEEASYSTGTFIDVAGGR